MRSFVFIPITIYVVSTKRVSRISAAATGYRIRIFTGSVGHIFPAQVSLGGNLYTTLSYSSAGDYFDTYSYV